MTARRRSLSGFAALFLAAPLAVPAFAGNAVDPLSPETRAAVAALAAEGASPTRATEWVRRLTDEVGPRLAGSAGDRTAVAWGQALLRELGFSKVRAEEVTVTAWNGEPRRPRSSRRIPRSWSSRRWAEASGHRRKESRRPSSR